MIAGKENVKAEPDALYIIAQKADGALRDALSIFDQMVTLSNGNITYKAVIDSLNMLDYDYYFKITDAVLAGNIPSALLTFNEILGNGFDGHHFVAGLAGHLRNLLVSKDASTLQLLEVTAGTREKFKNTSAAFSIPQLLCALKILGEADVNYRQSHNPRLLAEVALMRLCSMNKTPAPEEKKTEVKSYPLPSSKPATVNEPQKQEEKNIIPPGKKIIAGASISQFVNATPEKKNQPEKTVQQLPEDEFTADQLVQVWLKFASIVKQKGRTNFFAMLASRKPVLKERCLIEFTLDNKVQEEELRMEKTELMSFLRRELNNFSIELHTVISSEEREKKPYTAQEKFQRMMEKNPAIAQFRQQLDLEIDF
jgi:DNA polymerase-3 subunit gamma/tau